MVKYREVVLCVMITTGCVGQDTLNESQDTFYTISGDPLSFHAHTLIATENYVYAIYGHLYCFDWEGNLIWESQNLKSGRGIFLGDAFFITTYDESKDTGAVALLDNTGHVVWQRETGLITETGLGASEKLLAAGSRRGILYVFSRAGSVLWEYYNGTVIEQVTIVPGRPYIVFTDYDGFVKCVCDKKLMWQNNIGGAPYVGHSRNLAVASDSSYLVHGSHIDGSHLVVRTLDGEEVWSYSIADHLQSVAITSDSQYIVAACSDYIYKFTSDGILVWEKKIGEDNVYLAITPDADYIAFGSNESFSSRLIVLNGDGDVMWTKRSFDNMFAVAISFDGMYV